jgi:hypothetical protein
VSVVRCKAISSRSGEHNSQYVRTYSVKYRVETNDPLDGPQVVANHSELPELYSTYAHGNDVDAGAYLISRKPDEEGDSRLSWIVTCEYSTAPRVEITSNPLSEIAKAALSIDQFSTVVRVDTDGNWISNTMGQPFVPPPEMDQARPVLMVRKNEFFADLNKSMDYSESVNQTAWKGCAPRTVKCKGIQYTEIQQRNGVFYTEATYEFHLFDQTWDAFILNRATRFLVNGVKIELPLGMEPETIYTGEDGSTINEKVPRGVPVTRDAVYVRKRIYKERNFNSLNLNF